MNEWAPIELLNSYNIFAIGTFFRVDIFMRIFKELNGTVDIYLIYCHYVFSHVPHIVGYVWKSLRVVEIQQADIWNIYFFH